VTTFSKEEKGRFPRRRRLDSREMPDTGFWHSKEIRPLIRLRRFHDGSSHAVSTREYQSDQQSLYVADASETAQSKCDKFKKIHFSELTGPSISAGGLSGATPPDMTTEKVLNPGGIPENDDWPVSVRRMQRCLNNASVILPG